MEHLSPDDLTGSGRVMHDGHKPTKEQQAIFEALESSRDHLSIKARAGSGKTSTLIECVKRLVSNGQDPSNVLNCCFNKAIQLELDDKMPDGVWNKTMHAYGLGLIMRETDGEAEVDDRREKSKEIIDDALPGQALKKVGRGPVRRLTDLCKATRVRDDVDRVRSLVRRFGLGADLQPFRDRIIEEVPYILEEMFEDLHRVEFSDMVWQPIERDWWVFPKDVVFVDEAQDLSPVQHEMVLRLLSRGGRLVMVGDPMQSLYLFRATTPDSMDKLMRRAEGIGSRGVQEFPLTVTFRCPTHVVDLAQRIVPDFQAFRDDTGTVRHADPLDGLDELQRGDLVLCGKNAPLINAAYRLVAKRKPAMVRGRNIGKGLAYTTKRIAGQKDKRTNTGLDSDSFMEKLRTWRDRQLKDLDEDNEDGRSKVMDRYRCLKIIARESGNVGEMLAFIDDVFADVRDERVNWDNLIELSTVHKAKGREKDRVFILSPYEDLAFGVQAKNIAYVGITRAKEELVFLGELPPVFGMGPRWAPPEERARRSEEDQQEAAWADQARQEEGAMEQARLDAMEDKHR